jgi:excinuclease ABC subunit C
MKTLPEKIQAKLESLPSRPGVYLFRDGQGKILYVGKASSLRNRVKSYFQSSRPLDPKSQVMVKKIADLETLITDSEMEALILEANLIKEHKPRYNVNLKDDKRYPYLKVTVNEPYPRVLVVRRVKKDKAKYFGPYTNVSAMRQTLRIIRRIFPIRTCNLVIPSNKKYKVCLEYYIKRCLGPCEAKSSYEEYRQLIDHVCLFLAGHSAQVQEELKLQMDHYAGQENFEAAARIRDQIKALESMVEKQKVVDLERIDRDIISLARQKKDVCCVVLQIREGILIGRQNFYLTCNQNDPDQTVLSAFLKQFYLNSPVIPAEIVLPVEIEESKTIQSWLEQKKEGRVQLLVPQRGKRAELLDLAIQNARLLLNELMLQKLDRTQQVPRAVEALQRGLYLSKPPRTIIAFDISNLGVTDAVGSAIFFQDGRPRKSGYRKFKIKTVAGQDDFAMMQEIVTRYFSNLKTEGLNRPDLVLVDGGKGQLSSALEALLKLSLQDQEIIALAKRLDEVYLPGVAEPLMLPKTSPSLRLLQRIRDEAHRFAITYHRTRREKRLTHSALDDIAGIGESRKKVLLTRFGSVERIQSASLEAILAAEGISEKVALKIYQHFHPESRIR